MPGFTGFGGNSIGGDSQFGNMGSNDPYGSGNNYGGNNGHGGDRDNGGSSSVGNESVTVMKPGDSYNTPWGKVIINAAGQPTMNGTVMTADNSSMVPYGRGFTRVLNSLVNNPVSPAGQNGGKSPVQTAVENYLMVQSGNLPPGYWLSNGKVMTEVREERTSGGGGKNGNERTWTVKVPREVPQLTASYNEGMRIRQEAADRTRAEANARALAEEEARAIASGKSKAEFDAGKRVEAAQAAINTAQLNVNNLSGAVSAANQVITQKQAEMGPLNNELAEANKRVQDTIKYINDPILNRIHFNMLSARGRAQNNVDTKQNEINAAVANRDGLNAQLSQANNILQNARNEKSAADAALSAATEQRLQAESALRAAAEAAEKARQRQAEEAERQRQAMEVAEKAKDEWEVLEKTSELIAGMGDKIGEHLGDKYKSIAKDIADNIKNFQGRSLRSFDDAMASLNKITANPAMKINQADRDVLVNAWKHVDAQDMANKLGNLSKAFKVADVVMKVEKVREKSIEGYETGNWGPLMLEVESWVLSGMASAVALGIFGGIVSTFLVAGSLPATVAMIGGIITISYLASLIDAEVAEKINDEVINFIR